MEKINMPEEPIETVYDYFELADNAKSKKEELLYIEKALELEPDNLDALRRKADICDKDLHTFLQSLESLIDKGNNQMTEEGYFKDCMGDFWGVLETRPYMRLRHCYLIMLLSAGMMTRAMQEGEELLKLCENDNLGVRYILMNIYAFSENEKKMQALYEKYHCEDNSQMLFIFVVLYYKLYNFEKAKRYLETLCQTNKDAKKVLKSVGQRKFYQLYDEMSPYGYRPNTADEIIMEITHNRFLFSLNG